MTHRHRPHRHRVTTDDPQADKLWQDVLRLKEGDDMRRFVDACADYIKHVLAREAKHDRVR